MHVRTLRHKQAGKFIVPIDDGHVQRGFSVVRILVVLCVDQKGVSFNQQLGDLLVVLRALLPKKETYV